MTQEMRTEIKNYADAMIKAAKIVFPSVVDDPIGAIGAYPDTLEWFMLKISLAEDWETVREWGKYICQKLDEKNAELEVLLAQ